MVKHTMSTSYVTELSGRFVLWRSSHALY